MGKRKQQKTKEAHNTKTQEIKNQENQQTTANYNTPLRQQKTVQREIATQSSLLKTNSDPHQQITSGKSGTQQQKNNKTNVSSSSSKQQNQISASTKKQMEQTKISAPSCNDQTQIRKQIVFQNEKDSLKKQVHEQDTSQIENFDIAEEFDSGSQEVEGIPFSYNEEYVNQATNYYMDQSDEREYYEEVVNQLIPTKDLNDKQIDQKQIHQRYKGMQAFSKNRLLPKKYLQQIPNILNDPGFQSDLSHCLFCIYNNMDIEKYFNQLINVQRVLKEFRQFITPQMIYDQLVINIKDFMKVIRQRIVQDMEAIGIIQKVQIPRRYSYDDFFLVDNSFNRNFSLNGHILNEFSGSGIPYLLGDQYEKARSIARQNMLRQRQAKSYKVAHFVQGPEAYSNVFNKIIQYFTRVRDSVINLEEIWVFLMESVYQKEMKGQLIFEQIHKQLFDSEILKCQYIQDFFNEIKSAFSAFQLKKKAKQNVSKVEDVLENLYLTLVELEEEVNSQYQEQEEQNNRKASQDTNDQTGHNTLSQDQVAEEEQQNQDDYYPVILTYEQLKEKTRERQGGLTLAERFDIEGTEIDDKNILKGLQQDRLRVELMNNLPKLDTESLVYFIENKIPPKEYEKMLLANRQKSSSNTQNNEQELEQIDEFMIPNPKFENFEYYQDQNNQSEDEKQVEKKKRKNKKKKRKRKEKKIMAQQMQLDEFWQAKLQEEFQQREMRKQLIDYLQNASQEEYNQIQEILRRQNIFIEEISDDDYIVDKQILIEDEDHNEHALTCESDKEFEDQLNQFKERLELISKDATITKRKLVPNINKGWIHQLQYILNNEYSFQSPKTNHLLVSDQNSLWLSKQQHSA